MNEKQKKTTQDYRNNWDNIFKKKETNELKAAFEENSNENMELDPVLGVYVPTVSGSTCISNKEG